MTATQRLVLQVYGGIVLMWPNPPRRHHVHLPLVRLPHPPLPPLHRPRPPLVTAIVPAKDEEATLPDCLRTVCAQSYPNLEILVVDDRSADGTGRSRGGSPRPIRASGSSRSIRSRPAGRARRTRCTSRPARRGGPGSGSSTPTRGTSRIACRSSWNTPARGAPRWRAWCPRCGARPSGSASPSPSPASS